jgi:D-3-phosphoglycerate dehydrogenase
MIDTLRRITFTDRQLRASNWQRNAGLRLATSTVGIVGLGRIGKRVVKLLSGFGTRIAVADPAIDHAFVEEHGLEVMSLDRLLSDCDVVSLHVPLTGATENLIARRELELMKPSAVLVNTSRGGVVDEDALAAALHAQRIAGAAMDVFRDEPYSGPLAVVDRCVLTAHMGSMSEDCRARMEIEATEDAIRFIRGEPLLQIVPPEEYEARELASRAR